MNMILILLAAGVSLMIGAVLIFKPALVIELQRSFYLLINWRIEPISMAKEIRNTRLMGVFLVSVVLLTVLYLSFWRGWWLR